MKSYLLYDGILVHEGKQTRGSVLIRNGRITRIYPYPFPGEKPKVDRLIEASGRYILPGIIDDQVHFREPGLTHKGDIYTESKAAVAGGITSYMDMPNTIPQTITLALLEEKYDLAATKSLANYSFYLGATNDNLDEIVKTDPSTVCGVKLFMGASTGNMLVDNPETLTSIFKESPLLVAIHSEDEPTIRKNLAKYRADFGDDIPIHYHPLIRSEEACYKSTQRAVEMAHKHNTRLHILHLSTVKELSLFDPSPATAGKRITSEVCIHHLWFDQDDYAKKGSLIKWNPAIKKASDREGLFQGVLDDTIDIIATDHAPHTLEEKKEVYTKAPSGGPLVQHSLPMMMEFVRRGKISLEKVVEKMCYAPAILFRIRERGFIREGYWADIVIVDPDDPWTVTPYNIIYRCGWSPVEGTTFHSNISHTFVNGHLAYEEGIFNEEEKGLRLLFNRS
jgi:dihydroorotase